MTMTLHQPVPMDILKAIDKLHSQIENITNLQKHIQAQTIIFDPEEFLHVFKSMYVALDTFLSELHNIQQLIQDCIQYQHPQLP